jgi:hypothetical protein
MNESKSVLMARRGGGYELTHCSKPQRAVLSPFHVTFLILAIVIGGLDIIP